MHCILISPVGSCSCLLIDDKLNAITKGGRGVEDELMLCTIPNSRAYCPYRSASYDDGCPQRLWCNRRY